MTERAQKSPTDDLPVSAVDTKAQIIQALIDLASQAQLIIEATLQDFDVPASAATPLRILATSQAPVTPRDLAQLLDRDPSTASLIADKLEHAGLLERLPHPSDGRKKVLVLSDHGSELWDTLRRRLHDAAVFEGLTAPERHELLRLLTKMKATTERTM